MIMDSLLVVAQYMPRILQGAVLTLEIAIISVICSIFVGLFCALLRISKNPVLSTLAAVYSTVVRGVPDLIWMFILYYGVQIGVNQITDYMGWDYFEISPYGAGILTLTVIFGAYFTETFRGAYLSVPRGQIEAALAFGMKRSSILWRIIFPLMMRFALPSIKNNWLVLTKATALVSIIGLQDMVMIAQQAGSATHLSFLFNLVSALLFLLLTIVSLKVFAWIERHYQRGVRVVDNNV